MYGFQGLLTKDYPKSLELGGISNNSLDISWLRECANRSYFMPRGQVEENSKFKQIIPYVIIRCGDLFFVYQRDGAETRLTGNYSIGIGGHINPVDFSGDMGKTLYNSAKRELYEEVSIPNLTRTAKFRLDVNLAMPRAVLYAGNLPGSVNSVHFGVLHVLYFDESMADSLTLKDEGKQLSWMSRQELLETGDKLETWSKLVLEDWPNICDDSALF